MRTRLSSNEHNSIAAAMHIVALSAIARAKTWKPGELAFQGGTALHMAYGSNRYSEDLDFMTNSDVGLDRIARAASAQIQSALAPMYPGGKVSVKDRDAPGEAPRNPRMFTFTFTPPAEKMGTVKVRLEFWITGQTPLYRTEPKQVSIPAIRLLDIRLAPARAFSAIIPTGTLSEILVDKIHAMACREYPKPRDIFDLWLIVNGNGLRVPEQHEAWSEALARHGQMYRSLPIEEFPPRLRERAAYFGAEAGRGAAIKDLQRWLIGVNLADDLLRSMLDQTVKSIVEIADLIEKELNQPVPVASHRESSGNG